MLNNSSEFHPSVGTLPTDQRNQMSLKTQKLAEMALSKMAPSKLSGYFALKDAVTSGAYAAPSDEYRKYSKLRGCIIVMEGTISAGKTTLGDKITEFLNSLGIRAKFYQEFVEESLLHLFYSDQSKYAFAFQLFMLKCCIDNLQQAEHEAKEDGLVCIVDRSLWGNAVFAAMQKDKGNISDNEWATYLRILKTKAPCTADYVVYLDCNPAISFERIMIRGRQSEAQAKELMEYLKILEQYYTTAMLLHMQEGTASITPVQWDDFGTVHHVLDTMLDWSYLSPKFGGLITGDPISLFTKDRQFRARCIASLIRERHLHIEADNAQKTADSNAIKDIMAENIGEGK